MVRFNTFISTSSSHLLPLLLLSAVLTFVLSPQANAAKIAARQLEACLRSPGPEITVTHWSDSYKDHVFKRLHLHAVWHSRRPAAVNVTVVTQANLSRLEYVSEMCKSWGGPMSVAIYAPLMLNAGKLTGTVSTQLQQAVDAVAAMLKRVEQEGDCQMDAMLLYEVVEDDISRALHPVNYLRNYALLQAQTELVLLNDADNLISSGLMQQLKSKWDEVVSHCNNKTALVLPVFETNSAIMSGIKRVDLARLLAKSSKSFLIKFFTLRLVRPLRHLIRMSHGPTNYTAWLESSQPYPINFTFGYEPWFIIARQHVPMFDVRLRGYGANNALQGYHTAVQLGVKFWVWPDAWLLHQPHVWSRAHKLLVEGSKREGKGDLFNLFTFNANLGQEIVMDIRNLTYTPVVDAAVKDCLEQLPWWSSMREAQAHKVRAQKEE